MSQYEEDESGSAEKIVIAQLSEKALLATGIRIGTPVRTKTMPGTFTNPLYPGHIDAELVLVADPLSDAQAVVEAGKLGIPVIAVCDTDNVTDDIDLVIPGNNRGRKAIAAIFWLLARAVLTHAGLLSPDQPMKYAIEDFETKLLEEEQLETEAE